jgi:hypothetical protein
MAGILQEAACLAGFLQPLVRQVDVGPAGEAVFLVPDALAVAKQHDFFHRIPFRG